MLFGCSFDSGLSKRNLKLVFAAGVVLATLGKKVKEAGLGPYDWRAHSGLVIGVDEAGRGCLAGPVFAGAVLIKAGTAQEELMDYRDSKTISEARREEIFERLMSEHFVGIGSANPREIDEINILQASFLAMQRALKDLEARLVKEFAPEARAERVVLVDGNMCIPEVPWRQVTLVKGDSRATPISAASIAAKVSRDRYMRQVESRYPEYLFAVHKGYGTEAHREAIIKNGPCEEHRYSFRGVREYCTSL